MDDQIQSYVSAERSKGVPDEAIRKELVTKGWDSIAVHRVMYGQGKPAEPREHFKLTGPTVLLLVGVALIFIAAVSFFGYSWPQLSPLSRFLLIAVPNLLLLLVGSVLAKGEQLKVIKETTHTAGHMLLPTTIAVFLYQFGFYDKIDSLLVAYSVLIAFPLFLYVAIIKKHPQGSLLVTLGAVSITLFLVSDTIMDGWRSSLALTIVSLLTLWTAFSQKRANNENYLSALVSAGTIIFILSFPSLTRDVSSQLFSSTITIATVSGLIAGFGLLGAAALMGRLFTPWTRMELFHQRLLAIAGVFIAFGTLIGGGSEGVLLAIFALIFSALVVILGMQVKVRILSVLGIIGGVISLLNLLFSSIDHVTVVVIMFVLGFAAILLSIFLTRKSGVATVAAEQQWEIGYIGDNDANRLHVATGEPPSVLTIMVRIILIFLLYLLLQFVTFGVAAREGGNYSNPSDPGSPTNADFI